MNKFDRLYNMFEYDRRIADENIKRNIWTAKDGREIKIPDLTDSYLKAIITLLQKTEMPMIYIKKIGKEALNRNMITNKQYKLLVLDKVK